MRIQEITIEDLRYMADKEGLVIQGCGGDLQEWVDGLNDSLQKNGILRNGTKFENAYKFCHEDITCLLFRFEDAELDIPKMAMWRLQTHELYNGTWLSDYVENRLGGFVQEKKKPDCPLIGKDGNIFNLMGIASRTLKQNGLAAEAKEMCDRITSSGSYHEALCIIGEYVNITDDSEDEDEEECEEMEMM